MNRPHLHPNLFAMLALTSLLGVVQTNLHAEELNLQMLPRSVDGSTSLISNGKSDCAVIYPPDSPDKANPPHDESYSKMAKQIGYRLEALGARPELIAAPTSFEEAFALCKNTLKSKNAILIGSINSNHSILPLYAAFRDFTDAHHPGGDGYVIRTVVSPFGASRNAIILGGSSRAGTAKAVKAFLNNIPLPANTPQDVSVPSLLTIELGGDVKDTLQPVIRSAESEGPIPRSGGIYTATILGFQYALTGKAIFAQRARHAFLKTMGDSIVPWPVGDYSLEPLLRSWTMVADSDVFSPEERAWVEQRFLTTLIANQNAYWRRRSGGYIGSRHQTMGTSAFLATVRFLLQRGNPNAPAREMLQRWSRECRAYFDSYITTFHDDFEGIPTYHSAQPAINYVMEEGKFSYYEDGLARLAVLRAFAVVDNMGYYCGTGTYEEARPGTMKAGIMLGYPLAAATYFYSDSEYKWLLENFRGTGVGSWGRFVMYGCHAYATGNEVKTQMPTRLLGIQTVPLGAYRYKRLSKDRKAARKAHRWYTQAAQEQAFEKLFFRDSFSPMGQYLIIQGYQAVGADNVAPLDANSIVRYTDLGHIFLYHNSKRQGNFWRNAVFVSDGLNTDQLPGTAELIEKFDTGEVGFTATQMRDYYGTNWTRNIVWRRGRFFVVIDVLESKHNEPLAVFCNWRTPCAAELEDNVWEAREGKDSFHLLNADGIKQASYKYGIEGAASPTILRQVQSINNRGGEKVALFRNLLYAAGSSRHQHYEIKPIGERAIIARGSFGGEDVIWIAGIGSDEGLSKIGGFETNAKIFYIGSDAVGITPKARLSFRGEEIGLTNGRGKLPAEAIASLEELWRNTSVAQPTSEIKSAQEATQPLKVVWRYNGFTKEFAAVRGVDISSDIPPSAGEVSDLVDGNIPLWRGVGWQAGTEPTLEFDLHEEMTIAQIELATSMISRQNTLPDANSLPKPLTAKLELSNDGFKKDIRGRGAVFQAGFTIEPLHKGTLFAMGRYRLKGINEKARYIRLRLSARAASSGLREIFMRRGDATETLPTFAVADDLDSDGQKTILVAADSCELVALNADGRERWRYRFPGAITAIRCVELERGGGKAVLVAAMDQHIYCFEADGKLRWRSDSFGQLGGDLPCPYSIGTWQSDSAGRRQIVVGNYDHCSFLSYDGRLQSHTSALGAFETMILPEGIDLNDDGIDDTLLFNNWSRISFIDGKSRKMTNGYPCPRGQGIDMRLWGERDRLRAIVVVDNGLGIFDAKTGKYDWRIGTTPISSVAYIDLNDDGAEEIIIGKLDGFVLCFSEKGELLHRRLIGEPVLGVAASVKPNRIILAATASKLLVLDKTLRPLFESDANYFSLLPLGNEQTRDAAHSATRLTTNRFFGLKSDGSAEVFSLSLPQAR